jgi:putative oxidoreductase
MNKTFDFERWVPYALAALRIMTGLLFLEHGTQKIFGFPASTNPTREVLSLLGVQGLLEIAGGLLVFLGIYTRPIAFILCGDMAVAYFMSHAPRGFFPIQNGGIAAVLYCFVFLMLCIAGGGAWSVDSLRQHGKAG